MLCGDLRRLVTYTLIWCLIIFNYALGFESSRIAACSRNDGFRRIRNGILYMGRASNVRAATKAKTDDFKAKNYNNYTKKIIMAVKAGGADPVSNRLLNQLLQEAKIANVPKDVIARNIEKAMSPSQTDFKESVFEFYGHGGVGILVNVLTDNVNRAAADILLTAKKHELKQAAINSVAFKFTKKAKLILSEAIDEEEVLQLCLNQGIDDYQLHHTRGLHHTERHAVIYVDAPHMSALRNSLVAKNQFEVTCKMGAVPKEGYVSLPEAVRNANIAAMVAFEKLDDVDSIDHNVLL